MAKLLKIAKTKDVPPGQAAAFTIEGQKIALFNVEGTYYAIGDTCTHRGGPVSEGNSETSPTPCIPHWTHDVFLGITLAKTSLSPAVHLGDWRSEFDVEDRVRHCDRLIGRGAISFFERDFVCYRVTE